MDNPNDAVAHPPTLSRIQQQQGKKSSLKRFRESIFGGKRPSTDSRTSSRESVSSGEYTSQPVHGGDGKLKRQNSYEAAMSELESGTPPSRKRENGDVTAAKIDPEAAQIIRRVNPQDEKRQNVMYELLSTEQLYLRTLEVIEQVFYLPLLQSGLLNQFDFKTIFGNLGKLIPMHRGLVKQFVAQRTDTTIMDSIGEIFLLYADTISHEYIAYSSNRKTAETLIISLRQSNKAFDHFLDTCLKSPECRKLDFSTLLTTPLQRITRYPLLLQSLKGCTPVDHPDRPHLEACLESLESIVRKVEEETRRSQDMLRLVEIYSRLDYSLAPSGQEWKTVTGGNKVIVHEGELKYVREHKKVQDVVRLIVFDDMALICKPKKDKLMVFRPPIPLASMLLRNKVNDGMSSVSSSAVVPDTTDGIIESLLEGRGMASQETSVVRSESMRHQRSGVVLSTTQSLGTVQPSQDVLMSPPPSMAHLSTSSSPTSKSGTLVVPNSTSASNLTADEGPNRKKKVSLRMRLGGSQRRQASSGKHRGATAPELDFSGDDSQLSPDGSPKQPVRAAVCESLSGVSMGARVVKAVRRSHSLVGEEITSPKSHDDFDAVSTATDDDVGSTSAASTSTTTTVNTDKPKRRASASGTQSPRLTRKYKSLYVTRQRDMLSSMPADSVITGTEELLAMSPAAARQLKLMSPPSRDGESILSREPSMKEIATVFAQAETLDLEAHGDVPATTPSDDGNADDDGVDVKPDADSATKTTTTARLASVPTSDFGTVSALAAIDAAVDAATEQARRESAQADGGDSDVESGEETAKHNVSMGTGTAAVTIVTTTTPAALAKPRTSLTDSVSTSASTSAHALVPVKGQLSATTTSGKDSGIDDAVSDVQSLVSSTSRGAPTDRSDDVAHSVTPFVVTDYSEMADTSEINIKPLWLPAHNSRNKPTIDSSNTLRRDILNNSLPDVSPSRTRRAHQSSANIRMNASADLAKFEKTVPGFSIVHIGNVVYQFECASEQERDLWIKKLSVALNDQVVARKKRANEFSVKRSASMRTGRSREVSEAVLDSVSLEDNCAASLPTLSPPVQHVIDTGRKRVFSAGAASSSAANTVACHAGDSATSLVSSGSASGDAILDDMIAALPVRTLTPSRDVGGSMDSMASCDSELSDDGTRRHKGPIVSSV